MLRGISLRTSTVKPARFFPVLVSELSLNQTPPPRLAALLLLLVVTLLLVLAAVADSVGVRHEVHELDVKSRLRHRLVAEDHALLRSMRPSMVSQIECDPPQKLHADDGARLPAGGREVAGARAAR